LHHAQVYLPGSQRDILIEDLLEVPGTRWHDNSVFDIPVFLEKKVFKDRSGNAGAVDHRGGLQPPGPAYSQEYGMRYCIQKWTHGNAL